MGQLDGTDVLGQVDPLQQFLKWGFKEFKNSLLGKKLFGGKTHSEIYEDLMRMPRDEAEKLMALMTQQQQDYFNQVPLETRTNTLRTMFGVDLSPDQLSQIIDDARAANPSLAQAPQNQPRLESRPVATNPVLAQPVSQTQLPPEIQQTLPQDVRSVLDANNNKNFIQRMFNPKAPAITKDGAKVTHKMAWATDDSGGGIAYPTVVQKVKDGPLVELSPQEAIEWAKQTGEFIRFNKAAEAEAFADGAWKNVPGVQNLDAPISGEPQTKLPPEIQQTLPQSQGPSPAPSPADQIQQGLGFQSGGPQPPESPDIIKDEPLSIESILSDIGNIITSNPVQDILEKPKAKVESLPVIEDMIKQQPIWKPTIGSKGERWLPDGSLILENGKIMQPNGRVVDPQTGERSGQDAGMINRSVEAAGGRPPIVNGAPNLEGLKDLPVFGDKPSVTGTEPVFDLSKILQNGDGLPKNGQVQTSQGQSSSSGGKIGEGSGNILDIFKNLGFGKPGEAQGFSPMGTLSDIFGTVTTGLDKAVDWLGKGNNAATALGGAATIYNINQQKEAAEKMAAAMDNATAQQKAAYDQTRQDLAPYRLSPTAASGAAGFSPGQLPSVSVPGEQGQVLDTSRLTDPSQAIYGGSGPLPTPTVAGDFTQGLPDFTNFQDPAYEWMRKEGMRSIQNAGAARGRLDSGTTLQGLNEMGVGLAGQQMDKVARMRAQLFGERAGQQAQQFGQAMDLRGQLFGEGVTESQLKFGQLSDRERMEMGQQVTQFEQQQQLAQQKMAQQLQLRQMLFGEQLSADEQDFLQKYNMAAMGANAAAGMGNLSMQNASNLGQLAMGGGVMNAENASSRSGIINDFIKSLFVKPATT